MQISRLCLVTSLIAIGSAHPSMADFDVNAGQDIYQAQCSACHSNQPGANGIGPSLAGLAGRKAGSLQGFHFTPALQGSGLTWNAETFIQFLADPSKLVPHADHLVLLAVDGGREHGPGRGRDICAAFALSKKARSLKKIDLPILSWSAAISARLEKAVRIDGGRPSERLLDPDKGQQIAVDSYIIIRLLVAVFNLRDQSPGFGRPEARARLGSTIGYPPPPLAD